MRQFLLIVLLVIGIDQSLGLLLHRLYSHTTSGEKGGQINGVLRLNKVDVLVLGSSRAKHHVVPAILREKLSASVFNAGIDGHDFLYAIMLLDLWTRFHVLPKVILLHVDPTSLSYSQSELDRVSVFSGYYNESERIRSLLLMRGKYERIKYLSSSYRFNDKVLPIIKNLFMHTDDTSDGYSGLKGSLESEVGKSIGPVNPSTDKAIPFWSLKLGYLEELARYCKANGTRLILFHSPRFNENLAVLADWSKRFSALGLFQEGVEFIDLSVRARDLLVGQPTLFKDGGHLNEKGAEIFSSLLADEVARVLGGTAPNS